MNEITINDLQILSEYNFIENKSNLQNDFRIGVLRFKENSQWKEKLVKVNREDINCITSFLYGKGKLGNVDVTLDNLCSYLSKYNWEQIKLEVDQDKSTAYYKTFRTVCHLATRQLQHHKTDLFKRVSEPIPNNPNFYWNPIMNGRLLLDLQRFYLPNIKDLDLRFKDTKYLVSPKQKLTKEDMANIEVFY